MNHEEKPDNRNEDTGGVEGGGGMMLRIYLLCVGDHTLEQQTVDVTLKQRVKEPDDVIVEEEEDDQKETDDDLRQRSKL